jgi:plasmid stabilization system protein ParE
MGRYVTTPTARNHIRRAIKETRDKWGLEQAIKYRRALQAGLQSIAENHPMFNSPRRIELAKDTDFFIHHVEHRYVAFQEHNNDTIIIAGVFHESMDIPVRLKELQAKTQREIDSLKRELK